MHAYADRVYIHKSVREPVSTLHERVLVLKSESVATFSGTPLGGAEYFYRCRCDQIKNEMFAPLALGIWT